MDQADAEVLAGQLKNAYLRCTLHRAVTGMAGEGVWFGRTVSTHAPGAALRRPGRSRPGLQDLDGCPAMGVGWGKRPAAQYPMFEQVSGLEPSWKARRGSRRFSGRPGLVSGLVVSVAGDEDEAGRPGRTPNSSVVPASL